MTLFLQHALVVFLALTAVGAAFGGCVLAGQPSLAQGCYAAGAVEAAVIAILQAPRFSTDPWSRRKARLARAVAIGAVIGFCAGLIGVPNISPRAEPSWQRLPMMLLSPLLCGLTGAMLGVVVATRPRPSTYMCAKCGYDLRGCTHGRCPECGFPFSLRRVRKSYRRELLREAQRVKGRGQQPGDPAE